MSLYQQPEHILKALAERTQNGLLKKLRTDLPTIDFCSNDYLGFSRSGLLTQKLADETTTDRKAFGATGSRLVRGSTAAHRDLEAALAVLLGFESALVFSSGYLANLAAVQTRADRDGDDRAPESRSRPAAADGLAHSARPVR